MMRDWPAELSAAQRPELWSTAESAGLAVTDPLSGDLLGACRLLDVDHARVEHWC
jgi:hypothetical protein